MWGPRAGRGPCGPLRWDRASKGLYSPHRDRRSDSGAGRTLAARGGLRRSRLRCRRSGPGRGSAPRDRRRPKPAPGGRAHRIAADGLPGADVGPLRPLPAQSRRLGGGGDAARGAGSAAEAVHPRGAAGRGERDDRGPVMPRMPGHRSGRAWSGAAQALLGAAALAAVCVAGQRLQASTEAAALLFLFVVVPVAIWAQPVASVLVAILAVIALQYFFTVAGPGRAAGPTDPLDVVTVVAFAAAALIVTPVMAAVRRSFRKNAALRDQLRTIIDTIPTMVWSTLPDGTDDFVNRTWLEYTGLSVDQARGAGWQAAVHPEDLARVAAAWRVAATSGEPFEQELRLRRADGEYRWMLSRPVALRDDRQGIVCWYGTYTDIEDHKRAEEALRESEARFRSLTDLSSDWYWQQDENLRFTYLSSGAEDGASVIGKTRWEIDGLVPLSSSWPEHQAVLAARQPFRDFECLQVRPDGSVQYRSV